jgi:hypothetical protein
VRVWRVKVGVRREGEGDFSMRVRVKVRVGVGVTELVLPMHRRVRFQ